MLVDARRLAIDDAHQADFVGAFAQTVEAGLDAQVARREQIPDRLRRAQSDAGVGGRLPGEHQPGLQAGVLDGQRGGEGAHLDRVGGIDGRDPHHEGQHQGQHQGAQVVPQPAQHGRPLSDPAEQGERGRSTARTRPASSAARGR